jgi:hypothetical protein
MNNKIIFVFCLVILIPEILFSKSLSVIPKPQFFQEKEGVFELNSSSVIVVPKGLKKKWKSVKKLSRTGSGF